jgi:Flp pilus assembly protein TadB
MNIKLLVVAVSIVLLAVAAQAQEQRADRELMAKLEQMRSETEWKAQTLAGGPKQKWLLHQSRLNRLIDRLKAGQTVDPKEIDELLKEHSR